MVAAGICDEVLVQLAYAIGVAEPVGLFVNTYNTAKVNMSDGEIAEKIKTIFSLKPFDIIERFQLKNPIYLPTASYGHFGRDPYTQEVEVFYEDKNTYKKILDGQERIFKKVKFFAWEETDYVDKIKNLFPILN